jgi:DNA invertase Pin-like site-specific DNA recombinase
MRIGYARTSTTEQIAGYEAQQRELKAAGCERLFMEQLSSVDASRPQLEAALDFAREGDVLVVTRLDRLARSVADVVSIEKRLREKGAALQVMDPAMDTSTPTGRLVFNVIASIAQFEREIMLVRQREGIAKAKGEKNYWGRKPTARVHADEVKRLKAEGLGAAAIAEQLGIGRRSVYNILGDTPEEAAETFKHRAKVWNARKGAA